MSERVGNWCQTYTGKRFYPLDPRPEEVCLEDIAHALSMICRFGGACREFYSVAEHSVRVSHAAEILDNGSANTRLVSLAGLMHDAAEAYIGDMIRPLKMQPEMAPYRAAEHKIETAIALHFGIPFPKGRTVKQADEVLLVTEARDLMGGEDQWRCAQRATPLPERIVPLSQRDAKAAFLARFAELQAHT